MWVNIEKMLKQFTQKHGNFFKLSARRFGIGVSGFGAFGARGW